jgi:hypothetical protein
LRGLTLVSPLRQPLDMARRLWGCYSVADHLEPRAFVADLLLYDRLVVPVPSKDDLARWEERWDPARQQRLLAILGTYAERMEWSAPLRDRWEEMCSPAAPALDIDESAPDPDRPFELTRRVISEQLRAKAAEEGDVRGVAVYAKPDRFDRDWHLTGKFPFVRWTARVAPGPLREAANTLPAEQQDLAKVVVTRLVIPDDGLDDEEALKRTVDLVSRDDVAERRAAFHELLGSLGAEGVRTDAVVGEVEDLLEGLNESVKRHTSAQLARVAVHCLTLAQGIAGLWAPPVALAAGPTAVAGEALIRRRWVIPDEPSRDAVSLLAEAQKALE